jgi:hypothetical protein
VADLKQLNSIWPSEETQI